MISRPRPFGWSSTKASRFPPLPAISTDRSGGGRPAERTLTWVDRKGTEQPFPLPPRGYEHPRLSPDGQRVALNIDEGNKSDVWVYEIPRGTLTRLTLDGGGISPVWAPDGRKITYTSDKEEVPGFSGKLQTTAGTPKSCWPAVEIPKNSASWSPNGDTLAFTEFDTVTKGDIWVVSPKDDRSHGRSCEPHSTKRLLPSPPMGAGWPSNPMNRAEMRYTCSRSPGQAAKYSVSIQRRNRTGLVSGWTRTLLPQWRSDDGRRYHAPAHVPCI